MIYGNPEFPDQGPREWTPRIKKAFREIEWLRALIPTEVIKPFLPDCRWDSLTGKQMALALLVKARKWKNPGTLKDYELADQVWVCANGGVIVERGICDLLAGKVKGYEHLAGRWDGQWPPRKPVEAGVR